MKKTKPPLALLLVLVVPQIALAAPEEELPLSGSDMPIVLTPTRLRQSLADVPASVTIITSEMIKQYGIASIPDALRLVPGMIVNQVTGSDYRVGYHGGNLHSPRRMNVMVDGMSVYRPGFARVDWDQIPVSLNDIDRIEITRGPNSVTYGANSTVAIINILTKHPRDTEGAFAQLRAGSQDTAAATLRYSGPIGQSTSFRITFDHHQDSGFDFASVRGLGRDDERKNTLTLRSVTEFGASQVLDLVAGVQKVDREVEFADRFQSSFPDVQSDDYFVNARWRKTISDRHEIQIQASASHHSFEQPWRSCPPTATLLPEMFDLWRANPAYANAILAGRRPSGGSPQDDALAAAALGAIARIGLAGARAPTCVDVNQDFDETRYDAELQDTLVLSPALRLVGGIGVRSDKADSDTFFQGKVTNDSWRVFANAEYKPTERVSVNVGGFYEDDKLSESAFSPRVALNFHASANHTLRFVVSKAVRTPDIFEQRSDSVYRTTNWDPPLNGVASGRFFQSVRAPGNLRNERMLSREIGYLGNFPKFGMRFDAKVFDDELTHLISEKLQLSDFKPTNDGEAQHRGGELQLTYQPNSRWSAHLAYGYLDNQTNSAFERSIYSRHSGAAAVSYAAPRDWRIGFAVYQFGSNNEGQAFFGREDLTVTKIFRLGARNQLRAAFTASHLDNRSSTFEVDVGQTRESRYDDSMHYYLTLATSF